MRRCVAHRFPDSYRYPPESSTKKGSPEEVEKGASS